MIELSGRSGSTISVGQFEQRRCSRRGRGRNRSPRRTGCASRTVIGLVDPLQRTAVTELLAHADIVYRIESRRQRGSPDSSSIGGAVVVAEITGIVGADGEITGIAVVRARVDLAFEHRRRQRRIGAEPLNCPQADQAVIILRAVRRGEHAFGRISTALDRRGAVAVQFGLGMRKVQIDRWRCPSRQLKVPRKPVAFEFE